MAKSWMLLIVCGAGCLTGCENLEKLLGGDVDSASAESKLATIGMLTADQFIDVRDGQIYSTVTIGSQTWMAQNLNYKVDSSWCYDKADSNCVKYGRLYQWTAAMALDTVYSHRFWQGADSARHQGVCPAGWHIPTDTEWSTLINAVGTDSARIRLSSTDGWYKNSNGTNDYGFGALPSGYRYGAGFFFKGYCSYFWSASEYSAANVRYRYFSYEFANTVRTNYYKVLSFPVRCLKDE